jgi:FtsP/CotA-like multicopper oxidase with cupredoxin domain
MQRVKQAVGLARWTAALAVVIMAQAAAASDAGLQHVAAHVAVDQNDDPDVVEVYLTAREKMVQLGGGRPTAMRTYNGKVPGPTIEGKVGDTVIVHFTNELPEETTIHWHGLEVPSNMDGSNISQNAVPPGGTFRYEFKLLRAATYWYHPHIRTNEQIEQGLHGALVVRERDEEATAGLPEREHLLVLDDLLLDDEGNIAEPLPSAPLAKATMLLNGREGNTLLVNGLVTPSDVIRRGVPHRLRLINVANSRFMRLSIPGQQVFQVAVDGGLLEEPVEIEPIGMVPDPDDPGRMISDPDPTKGLLLTPGDRAEIVFTPTGEGPVRLEWHDIARGRHSLSYNDTGGIDIGDDENDGKSPPQTMLTLKQVGPAGDAGYLPPEDLASIEPIDVTGAETITFEFGHTPAAPNGNVVFFVQRKANVGQCPLPPPMPCPLPFPMVTPDDAPRVRPGDVRIIEVNNLTGGDHNFHMHGFFFQHIETVFIDMDSPTPSVVVPAERVAWNDTIKLPRRPGAFMRSRTVTRLAVRFDDTGREGQVFASGKLPGEDSSGGWVLHCHILEHADGGMMSFLQVVE